MADSITLPFFDVANIGFKNLIQTYLLKAIDSVWRDSIKEFALQGTLAAANAQKYGVDTGMSAATFSVAVKKDSDADAIFSIVSGKKKRSKARPFRKLDGTIVRNKARFITSGINEAKKGTKTRLGSSNTPEWTFKFDLKVWQLVHVVEPKTKAFTIAKSSFWLFFLDNFKKYLESGALNMPKIKVQQVKING